MADKTHRFDRTFSAADEAVFSQLVRGLVGQKCSTVRKGYGRAVSLHFGTMQEHPVDQRARVHKQSGAWVINLWDCDRFVSLSDKSAMASRSGGDEAVLEELKAFVGARIANLELDPDSLSLTVQFVSHGELRAITDQTCGADSEQWAIELPDSTALVFFAKKRWAYESGNAT